MNRALAFPAILAFALCGNGSEVLAYAGWKDSADLILDTSPAGAGVTATLAGFPVLVRLNADDFPFAEAQGRGQDIRFSKPDGTRLAHEIERWDSAHAVAEVWVRVDTIRGNDAKQSIRMRWGNAAAEDASDGGAVFGNRQVGVWHLGGEGPSPRANSVAGAPAAGPYGFDGDESTTGIIGLADSLDGDGDYLDIGNGYAGFDGSFMFSAWVRPASAHWNAPFLELGNGTYADNLMLSMAGNSDDFMFTAIDSGISSVDASAFLTPGEWQFVAVTVDGDRVKLYRNGRLTASGYLDAPIRDVWRVSNFLGKSSWTKAGYFQGVLDEPEIHRVVHSESWIKLAYQNQRADQKLVLLKKPMRCADRFLAPRDTSVAEGGSLILSAGADCAESISWSAVSGPAPRILDPETRDLPVRAPRVSGDTALVYRFTAVFRDSTTFHEVRVRVLEAIPDPAFTFPSDLTWSGSGNLVVRPVITNLQAIKESPEPSLHWSWTLAGPRADTLWLADGILMAGSAGAGELQIGLCLDNEGPATCGTATLRITATTSLNGSGPQASLRKDMRPAFDAAGRRRPAHGLPHGPWVATFLRTP